MVKKWWSLSLISLAFQNENCKLLQLLSINIPREYRSKLKNNTDRRISVHKVDMIKLQLKTHVKDYCLRHDGILKLSPPINNWTKHLTSLRRQLDQFMSSLVQPRSLDSITLE